MVEARNENLVNENNTTKLPELVDEVIYISDGKVEDIKHDTVKEDETRTDETTKTKRDNINNE